MKKDKLHTIKSSGYKAPEAYFKTFDAKLLERLDEKVNIDGIETSGYTIPEDYFNTVEDQILVTLKIKPQQPVFTLKSRRTFYYVAGIAASFALLFSLVINTNDELTIDALNTASIENYLYQEDYTNDDLASLFESDDISETDFIDVTISDEILNQYLESFDTDDLILD